MPEQQLVTIAVSEIHRSPRDVHLTIFVGRPPDGLRFAGEMTVLVDEWDEIVDRAGIDAALVEVWPPAAAYVPTVLDRPGGPPHE